MHPLLVFLYSCLFISIFYIYLLWPRVNHILYWVKIQERKILEFSRLTNLSDQISISILLSQIFQEAVPYFTKTPQHRGLVIFFMVLLGCTELLYLLYYCILFFYKDLFFSRFYRYFIGAKYFIHPPLDELLCQRIIYTEFRQLTFFFFFPTIYLHWETRLVNIWLYNSYLPRINYV